MIFAFSRADRSAGWDLLRGPYSIYSGLSSVGLPTLYRLTSEDLCPR